MNQNCVLFIDGFGYIYKVKGRLLEEPTYGTVVGEPTWGRDATVRTQASVRRLDTNTNPNTPPCTTQLLVYRHLLENFLSNFENPSFDLDHKCIIF